MERVYVSLRNHPGMNLRDLRKKGCSTPGDWICLSVGGVCHNTNICGNWGKQFFETGQKRKRYCVSTVQTTFLETQLKDNKLDTQEDRQKVSAVFSKESKETFDVERIHTWFRNWFYYESMKRKLWKPIYECRCNERLQKLRNLYATHTLGWSWNWNT